MHQQLTVIYFGTILLI